MKEWLKALLSQTVLSVWWILSGFSTLCTFFFHGWASEARIVLTISAILGFAWANFKVFREQERRLAALGNMPPSSAARTAQLKITQESGSLYILKSIPNTSDFTGIFLEFRLMIENLGQRNSTVNQFEVEIAELNKSAGGLKPEDRSSFVQTRRGITNLNVDKALNKAGVVNIDAEKTTAYGTLLLFFPANRAMFSAANLTIGAGTQRHPPLHCRLILTDTTGSSACAEFELQEA